MIRLSNEIGLVSVNVAEPEVIGRQRGRDVLSAIKKRPVIAGPTIAMTTTNLDGDRQADLRVHGGPEKAVYAYPSEHWARWNAEIAPAEPFGAGTFGENLSTLGIDETEACIGDVWAWGTARLQICQPRYPCFKLAMATRRLDVGKLMLDAGRSGWYLRVLTAGEAPVAGPIAIEQRDPAGVTVLDALRALLPGSTRPEIERVIAVEALAVNWRGSLEEKIEVGAV